MKRLTVKQRKSIVIIGAITLCTVSLFSLIYLAFFSKTEPQLPDYRVNQQLAYHSSQPGTPAMQSIAHQYKAGRTTHKTVQVKRSNYIRSASQTMYETSNAMSQNVGPSFNFVPSNGLGIQLGQSNRSNPTASSVTMPTSSLIALSGTQLLTPLTETGQAADPQTAAMASLPTRNAPNPPHPTDPILPDEHQIGNEPAPVGTPLVLLIMAMSYAIGLTIKRSKKESKKD